MIPEDARPVLDYAPPALAQLPFFRTLLAACAVFGIVANLGVITNSMKWLQFGSRAYRDLSLNPKAYGRMIDSETVASLRNPYWLWTANACAVLAAIVGIFLALYLLASLVRLHRTREEAVRHILRYRRWKMPAAVATLVAMTFAEGANYYLEGAATHHISVGTWLPGAWPLMLFVGALVPRWWIGAALGGHTMSKSTADEPVHGV